LWTEVYRPRTLDQYVFRDDAQKTTITNWVTAKSIPHLLFSGAPGVGKTTLAKILINELEINDFDVLEINASRENSVDTIRDKIVGFVQTMPFGEFKIVLLDEADFITPNGQAALRGVMETYHETVRFILTCNYPNKIIPALHSRCQGFHIDRIDQTEFTARIATILVEEHVQFDLDTLDSYVKATYPDLRKCINSCQMNCTTGSLQLTSDNSSNSQDYMLAVIDLFKKGRVKEARETLCKSIRTEEIESMYRWMYDNLDLWGQDDFARDEAIIKIRNGLVNHSLVADPEINLSACLIELSQINK
jgi:DNA polymerase III delta prime subunit